MATVNFTRASNAVETKEVFLTLLEFTHPDMPNAIYFVDNTTAIVSNGTTYDPYPFEITLPEDTEGVLPQVKLKIDNVDRVLTDAIRGFSNPPVVTLKIILASNPDTVEMKLENLKLRNVTFDMYSIKGNLVMDSPLARKFPASTFNPKQYPALFFR